MKTHKNCATCKELLPLDLDFFGHRSGKRSHEWRPYCRSCEARRRTPIPKPKLITNGQKTCRVCKLAFPATEEFFGLHSRNGPKYLRPYCRSCSTVQQNRWVSNNREKARRIAKRNYDKNRSAIIAREVARDKAIRADPTLGPLRRAQYSEIRKKRLSKPEARDRLRKRDREYAKTDIGKARYSRRRAKQFNAPGNYTQSDVNRIAERQSNLCFWCGANILGRIVADHYIPLSRGGSNYPENIVASCGSCNSKKHNKMPDEFLTYLTSKAAKASRLLTRLLNTGRPQDSEATLAYRDE
jgi:5-methylcytosine-specific restriction endonuclease McrA